MQKTLRRTFASLAVYNFRLYFVGQGLSLCGTWMQTVSLALLVLKLTHSGTQLGLVVAAQFLPACALFYTELTGHPGADTWIISGHRCRTGLDGLCRG